MLENPNSRTLLIPHQPSKEVQEFLTQKPSPGWRDCLSYVLSHYPQVEDGAVNYLIEGGVAIKLLIPERQEPDDVDIITRDVDMSVDFRNSHRFDVKSLQTWYAHRLHPFNVSYFTDPAGGFVLDMHESVSFEGLRVLVMNRLALAVSKTMRYHNRSPREKDLGDLALLGQDANQVNEVIQKIQNLFPVSKG